ncbi:hypothetical protein CBR_g40511 [Chara braunii]|uniref:Reverse transcriptase domain-containing protein n=1 Tax=Chara braunii TaxID=69332 RepID=A0A388K223_CHABU|nr:hypothetical protein CBR_g40511 [Chara braunii]|eukprot:GBG64065.1 hypothetical protein CBR_g40511 [Chara braunii]
MQSSAEKKKWGESRKYNGGARAEEFACAAATVAIAVDMEPRATERSGSELLRVAEAGQLSEAQRLIEEGFDVSCQDEGNGTSALMLAASKGHVEVVRALLEAGAPWNALDQTGRCAGDYAVEAHQQEVVDLLLDAAVCAELVLGASGRHIRNEQCKAELPSNESYLNQRVKYDGDKLIDEESMGVMMAWERPLMEAHAQVQLRDYLHTAVPAPLMDAGVEFVDLHDYVAKIDREFKTQRDRDKYSGFQRRPSPLRNSSQGIREVDTWLRAVPVYVRCKLTLPHEEVLVAASCLEGSATRWLSGLVQLQGYGHDFHAWAVTQKLDDFLKLVEERWHDPQEAQRATDAILTLHTRQFKLVREATDAVERLIFVPGVRYDPQVLLTSYLRCFSLPLRNQLAGEANINMHNFPSFSKKALNLEAKIGHGHAPTTDGRKKTLPPNWKAKGRLMFVDNDGSTIELDGNFQEGVGSEAGSVDASEGGVVAVVSQKGKTTGRRRGGSWSRSQVDPNAPPWEKAGLTEDVLHLQGRVQRLSRPVESTCANKQRMVVNDYLQDIERCFPYVGGELRHCVSFLVSDELPMDMLLGMCYLPVAQPQFDLDRKVVKHTLPGGGTARLHKFKTSSLIESHGCMCAAAFYNYYKQNQEEGIYLVYVSAAGEPVKMSLEIEGVVAKYPDVFEEPTGVVEREVVHAIEIIAGSSISKGRIYRMSPSELDELRRQLKELVEKGWIRPSVSPYGSPVLFVPKKKEGKLRMCIDYRGLNAITVKNREPLPHIDYLLDRVQGCRYFSKIDLKSGYHQIAIRPEDQHKTAFQTRYGLYKFVVRPFGLCNAPGTFQHAMNRIFHDYLDKFVIVYLDDILIFSKTVEEHVAHLDKVSLLRQHKFKINGEKCEFGRTRVLYLGHEISAEGLKPDDAKVANIRDWPRPQSVTEMRSFFGMTDYYRTFVKNYSIVAAPLTDLTRLDTPWEWTDECETDFRHLKHALMHYEVLKLPDPDKPFIVTTDASQYGIGAVLAHQEGPKFRPMEYMSKKMPS